MLNTDKSYSGSIQIKSYPVLDFGLYCFHGLVYLILIISYSNSTLLILTLHLRKQELKI